MKAKIQRRIALGMIVILFSSFNRVDNVYAGVYGVCGSNSTQMKLTIRPDSTFTYKDFSDPKKELKVMGNWMISGGKLILKQSDSGSISRFHNVWSFSKDGKVIKSRMGLAFYKLSKINN